MILIVFMGLPAMEAYARPARIPVLAYHSVMPQEFYHPINADNTWILHEETFYAQMRYLYENGFTTLTSYQLLDFLHNRGDLPDNPIIITFDDGYLDNYLYAAPILRKFGFTAMMFLITGAIHEKAPEMTAYPTQFAGWPEVLAATDVFEHGSHTHAMHRAIEGRVPLAFESVENIRTDLQQSFDAPLSLNSGFAFPQGIYSRNALEALAQESVQFAFTTRRSYVNRNSNPLLLPRFLVESYWTIEMFSDIAWGRW